MNIYPINESYKLVLAKANLHAENNEGETDEHLEDLLASLGEQRDEALIGLMYEVKNLEAEEQALKIAKAELVVKHKAVVERIEKRKQVLARVIGKQALTDGVVKVTKAVSESLEVFGEVPAKYKSKEVVPATTKTIIDTKGIKADAIGGDKAALEFARIVRKKSVK